MPFLELLANARIASAMRASIKGLGWNVSEEVKGALAHSQKQPDILITRPSPEPPIVIENEYKRGNIKKDCLNKLGQTLTPEYGGATISAVVGIYSRPLRAAANSDEADEMLRSGQKLQYAVYTGTPEKHERFPQKGFISGDVRNLVEFIKPAAEPEDIIKAAADKLAEGAERAATHLLTDRARDEYGPKMGDKLRQPWPTAPTIDRAQADADSAARRQTANMAATIIINALAYQQILDGHKGIRGFAQLRESETDKSLSKDTVVKEFNHILGINFWPIFHIAKELLLLVPAPVARGILEGMAQTADDILPAIRHSDVANIVRRYNF